MNEVIQNILTRRSVRAYKEEQISYVDLNVILEATICTKYYERSGLAFYCCSK